MTRTELIKKLCIILSLTILLIGSMIWDSATHHSTENAPDKATARENSAATGSALSGIQGVWISFGDYKNAGLYNKSESTFTANADKYFKKLKADGINTVYFHVAPCNDAIYPSEYLGWSRYMFKSAPNYDPLEILVDKAHKYKMTFHAWINPYRKVMGGRIFNPGKQSSTNRIVRIVNEIIENYDVDGIHFDDYFYPAKSKGAQLSHVSIPKRKRVINRMVKKVYQTVKNYDKNMLFGISPAGNIEYAESLGCDLSTWMSKSGYIDYIVPQIYWSDQYRVGSKTVHMYSNRLEKWVNQNKNGTPMYIGLALYRGGCRSSSDIGWSRSNNNIVTQIKKLKEADCEGFVLFSSAYLYKSTTKKEARNYRNYIR